MASNGYDTVELEKEALEAIERNFLTFFDDISLYTKASRATLYNHGLDALDTIKEALKRNRLMIKREMRQRWQKHDSPVLQIAAYKLIATDEEISKITMTKVAAEHTGKDGGAIQTENKFTVEVYDYSNNEPEAK